MRQLDVSTRLAGQEARYNQLVGFLIQSFGVNNDKLSALSGRDQIRQAVIGFLQQNFAFAQSKIAGLDSPDPVCQTAIAQNRLIYIPQDRAKTIFVSGKTQIDNIDIFECTPDQMDLKGYGLLPNMACLAVIPITTASGHNIGAIMMASRSPQAFDPLVDLAILRMAAEMFAAALMVK